MQHDIDLSANVELLPCLLENIGKYFIVTDEEAAIVQAIQKCLPGVDVYRCWNHVIKDAQRKLGQLGLGKRDNINGYTENLYALLRIKKRTV